MLSVHTVWCFWCFPVSGGLVACWLSPSSSNTLPTSLSFCCSLKIIWHFAISLILRGFKFRPLLTRSRGGDGTKSTLPEWPSFSGFCHHAVSRPPRADATYKMTKTVLMTSRSFLSRSFPLSLTGSLACLDHRSRSKAWLGTSLWRFSVTYYSSVKRVLSRSILLKKIHSHSLYTRTYQLLYKCIGDWFSKNRLYTPALYYSPKTIYKEKLRD